MAKTKDRDALLEELKEKKNLKYEGYHIRINPYKTVMARKEWTDIFKLLNEIHFEPRVHYSANLSFTSDSKELATFAMNKPTLNELLNGHIYKSVNQL